MERETKAEWLTKQMKNAKVNPENFDEGDTCVLSDMKETSLSEKRFNQGLGWRYEEEEVREAVLKDWGVIQLYIEGKINLAGLIARRKEIFGSKLT